MCSRSLQAKLNKAIIRHSSLAAQKNWLIDNLQHWKNRKINLPTCIEENAFVVVVVAVHSCNILVVSTLGPLDLHRLIRL